MISSPYHVHKVTFITFFEISKKLTHYFSNNRWPRPSENTLYISPVILLYNQATNTLLYIVETMETLKITLLLLFVVPLLGAVNVERELMRLTAENRELTKIIRALQVQDTCLIIIPSVGSIYVSIN